MAAQPEIGGPRIQQRLRVGGPRAGGRPRRRAAGRHSAIKYREPSTGIEAPFGTVVELIREAFTAGSVSASTYDDAVSLLGVPRLIDLMSLAGMYASTAALLTVFDM